ncbi:MAG: cytochrome c [Rubrivivax sp.]|jgi:mono/diheme cytochrome c family protein|nr:cytochrome c [Rubrivivax sp.]
MFQPERPGHRVVVAPGFLLLALTVLAGCSGPVQVVNLEPAQQLARESAPPGSAYLGWRLFQDKCAGCHGGDAAGSATAPNLLPLVREMGPRRFADLVLYRYDTSLPGLAAGDDAAAREARVDQVLQRRAPPVSMPAWQGEPAVSAQIADLYAWLAARADGTLGPGRPAR